MNPCQNENRGRPRKLPKSIANNGTAASTEDIAASAKNGPGGGRPITLSQEQHKVMLRIMKRKNTFFTGAAGTGKSYCISILEEILKILHKTKVVGRTAPTGVAACNINGMTLHSWAGVGLGQESVEKLVGKIEGPGGKEARERWKTTEILVIDEISMLPASLFEKINLIGEYSAVQCRESLFPRSHSTATIGH